MAMSLRLSTEDEKLIREYAKLHNLSISEVVRQAVIEKIEDEIDLRLAKEALAEYEADPTTYTMEEVDEMLGFKDV